MLSSAIWTDLKSVQIKTQGLIVQVLSCQQKFGNKNWSRQKLHRGGYNIQTGATVAFRLTNCWRKWCMVHCFWIWFQVQQPWSRAKITDLLMCILMVQTLNLELNWWLTASFPSIHLFSFTNSSCTQSHRGQPKFDSTVMGRGQGAPSPRGKYFHPLPTCSAPTFYNTASTFQVTVDILAINTGLMLLFKDKLGCWVFLDSF